MKLQCIHQLFEQQADAFPDSIAIADAKESLTYRQLNIQSNQLANYIIGLRLPGQSVVTIMLDNSNNSIVSILGILKAGCAFLPVDPGYPFERIKYMINESGSSLLISEKKYVKGMNKLQWECAYLKHILCIDSNNIYGEEESVGEKMNVELWNYVGEMAQDDITGGGWVSGFDGIPFSRAEMDEYAENAWLKLLPYLNENTRVLEIGCSSGITMFRIAPTVKQYTGIDLSSAIISNVSEEVRTRGLTNISLYTLAAHQLEEVLQTGPYDIIILNSVIQNFNGLNYLRNVIKDAVRLMAKEGVIFLGDLLDQDLKDDLVDSFTEYKRNNPGKGVKTKTDWNNDLFIARDFLTDLCVEVEAVKWVAPSSKIGAIKNELTKFRFDAILGVDKASGNSLRREKCRYQADVTRLYSCSGENPQLDIIKDSLAYVLYTSGSSGTPKGVMVAHESVLNYVQWFVGRFRITPYDATVLHSKITFDGVYTSIWGALLTGGLLRIVSTEHQPDPAEILNIVARNKITYIKLTPSLLNMLINDRAADKLLQSKYLRMLVIGGEAIKVADIEKIWSVRKDILLINHYGPTEATIGVVYHEINKTNLRDFLKRPVIGIPILNTSIYILNGQMELLPEHIPGEIYIGGKSLARGYLNYPELTRQKFVQNPYARGESEKLYRTGDIGRWLPGGIVELIGRLDEQVKIRGYRIELAEIEQAILKYPGIVNCKTLKKEDKDGHEYLAAYYISTDEADYHDIRSYLERQLPSYMIPAYFVRLHHFPVNNSGKLDVKALPDISKQFSGETYTAPQTDIERNIAALWRELLQRDSIDIDENFFEIGGHSLKATRLCSLIYKNLNIEVSLRTIFERPTIRQLGKVLGNNSTGSYHAIVPVEESEFYETSHGQMRLWLLSQREESFMAYLSVSVKSFQGNLNIEYLERAFLKLLTRHEILRTTFHFIKGQLKQKIRHVDEIYTPFEIIDLRTYTDPEFVKNEIINSQFNTVFDLEYGPLYKICLVLKSDDQFLFVLTIHHIIIDGLSNEVILDEISGYYNNDLHGISAEPEPLRIQYKDFAHWQNRMIAAENIHAKFWREYLDGYLPLSSLPVISKSGPKGNEGRVYTIQIGKEVYGSIKELAKEHEFTVFMFALSSIFSLLYRYTGQHDITVGNSIAGREDAELENQIGFYINTLPLRLKLTGNETFNQLLDKVKNMMLDVFEHRFYPYDKILAENNNNNISQDQELIEVMVNWQTKRIDKKNNLQRTLEGIEINDYPSQSTFVKFHLTFNFLEYDDRVVLNLEYKKDLFSEEQVQQICAHLLNLVTSAIQKFDSRIDQYNLLSREEHSQLMGLFNATDADFPETKTVVTLFEEQVVKTPGEIAIELADRKITYEQVNVLSNQLARLLQAGYNVKKNDLVGIMLDHSEWTVISILAVLKCGAAYVPVDPSYPAARKNYMISDAGVACVLCEGSAEDIITNGAHLVQLNTISDRLKHYDAGNLIQASDSEHTAYVIYTSGSTGKPKGCLISHKSLLNYLYWAIQKYSPGETKRNWPLFSSLSFDFTITSIFCPILTGNKIFIFANNKEINKVLFQSFNENSEINAIKLTPSHIELLAKLNIRNTNMELVVVGGEALTPRHIQIVRNISSAITIVNEYGPTEATVGCIVKTIDTDEEPVLIGKSISNTRIYILDEQLQLQPVGVEGEICISGQGLAKGYMHQEEMTALKFVKNPYEPGRLLYKTGDRGRWTAYGEVEYLGRKDAQIKIRGNRVEIGEIEKAVQQCEGVDAAAIVVKRRHEELHLACYYLSAADIASLTVRDHIARQLPDYMIPDFIIKLETFPLTENGKLDRSKLPDPFDHVAETGSVQMQPVNETETMLLSIWKEVLGREKINTTDNFFSLGGHSLNAVKILMEIENQFNVQLTLKDFFEKNNIAELAFHIKTMGLLFNKKIAGISSGLSSFPLSHAQKSFWILSQTEEASAAYTICSGVVINGKLDVDTLEKAFRLIVDRHEILRTHFVWEGEEVVQKVYDDSGAGIKPEYIDLSLTSAWQNELKQIISKEKSRVFYFDKREPLFCVKLIALAPEKHLLVYFIHHIICDAESLKIIFSELFQVYDALKKEMPLPLQSISLQFRDYAVWEKEFLSSTTIHRHRAYWNNMFSGKSFGLPLQTDFPVPQHPTFKGDNLEFHITAELSAGIRKMAADQQCSLFMCFITAVNVLLKKYTEQDTIIIGIPVSTRLRNELKDQVGPYLNTLPVLTEFHSQCTFISLLQDVQSALLQSFEFQNYPFDMLVNDLNIPAKAGHNQLFDIMVSYQHMADTHLPAIAEGISFEQFDIPATTSQFMLSIDFYELPETIKVIFNYNTDVFKAVSMRLMKTRFCELLTQIIKAPYERIVLLNPDRELETSGVTTQITFDY